MAAATGDTKPSSTFRTGESLRLASRAGQFASITSGQAFGYLQASPVILPSRYARDFRELCSRNPVPCPLLAESPFPGCINKLNSYIPGVSGEALVKDLDIRRDTPRYMVYEGGNLVKDSCVDIMEEWNDDFVVFLIGCSYSFETALTEAGLPPRHNVMKYNCPMYRTTIPINPAGVFKIGTYVVSMRTYKRSDVEKVIAITRPFKYTHGEPIAWGWDAIKRLGLININSPEWGDPPLTERGEALGNAFADEDNVPVFWGCGVTPQDVIMQAKLPCKVLCHCPGHILVLDAQDSDVKDESS